MGEYDQGAAIPGLDGAASGQPGAVRYSGAWKNPPGWKGRWCWMGTVTVNPPQTYTIGMKRGKPCRIPVPAAKQKERPTPDLIFVESSHEYLKHIDPKRGDGWVDARDMPMKFREMIVDAFGEENLNEIQRDICAPVLRARAETREAAKRIPARAERSASAKARPREKARSKR